MTKEIKKKYISLLGLNVIEQNACDPDLLIEETKEFETYTAWSAAHVSPAPKPKNSSFRPLPDWDLHDMIMNRLFQTK